MDDDHAGPSDLSALYRAVLEGVQDYAIYALDACGRVLSWNTGAQRMKGWQEREVIGRDAATFFTPEDVAAGVPRAHLADAEREGRSDEEGWQVRKDGSRFWARVITTPLRDEHAVLTGFAKVTHDLTERRQAEMKLRESELRFRRAFEDAAIGMSITAADGQWIRVNHALCTMLGYSPAELMQRDFQSITHPDDVPSSVALMYRGLAGHGDHHVMQKRYIHKDGHEVWARINIVVIRDRPDLDPYFLTQIEDITHERHAQHALSASEAKFRSLSVASPVGIFQSDPMGSITYANPRLLSIFELEESEGLGYGWLQRLHPDDREPVMTGWTAALQSQQEYSHEYRLVRPDGGIRWVRCQAAPLLEGSELTGTVGTVQDITERRTLEAQLRQAQKLEAVGRLAGGIAHDFNNLLTVISGNVAFAREALPPDSAPSQDLLHVETAATRASELTRQLLAFSRQQVLAPRRVDLNESVRQVSGMLSRVIGDDVSIQTRLTSDSCSVHVDPGQLHQVLMNLVMNARDAMPKGGAITISSGRRNIQRQHLYVDRDVPAGEYVYLEVSDEGVGIPPDALPRVFDPFFTTKEVGKGTGLGLATVYGIIAQSGGHILAESTLGEGSRFTVLLPLLDEQDGEPSDAEAEELRPGSARILVVEDNAAVAEVVERMLTSAGYRVVRARDGLEALDLVASLRGKRGSRLDLVLTDLEMPGLGGLELVERLRARCPEMKAVLMTGYSRMEASAEQFGSTSSMLQKPFSRAGLLERIRRVLEAGG